MGRKKKEKKKPKTERKTITILKSEWEKWMPIKGNRSWTFLMRDARIALETVDNLKNINKKLNETLQEVAVENAKLLARGVRVMTKSVHPDAVLDWNKKNSSTEHTLSSNTTLNSGKKAELLKEIKDLSKQEGGICAILKPMDKKELHKLQLSEKELNKRIEVQIKRVQLRHLKPPSPPSTK